MNDCKIKYIRFTDEARDGVYFCCNLIRGYKGKSSRSLHFVDSYNYGFAKYYISLLKQILGKFE